ncbi:FAD-dependent oxidoreductase [Actinomycetospora endophytica]|uniref:FAD-dependent oxidoreductase n=1 Tax=Actinomycetospora endophytica TaxID=2291215 RepID=A0ABS8P1T4_9PSEU|nr:FAD-dependent oxidoreductase [Actinomycetospora endophytica]MCD2192222.1 FAD-dependent oxidoreductase [Actinomycetospora endophytica]
MADLVVVGASLAGLKAAEAVRGDGFEGSVALIGAEEHLPYDRPPLSKEHLANDEPGDSTYREQEKLDELGVELVLGAPATALDLDARTVTVGDQQIGYGGLVIATGADARALPASVCAPDLAGVVTLRTRDDSAHLHRLLRADGNPRVTVVGAGFIGSEIAAVARKRGHEVTIVEALPVPLVRGVGERMGRALTDIHERHGTRVLTGVSVAEVRGTDAVEAVVLADGTVIDTDVLVVGIGAAPNTGWLESSGLTLSDGVVADETLAAAPGVYVAGDVARWPNALFDDVLGSSMRLEHWTSASEQGARAARNAVDPSSAQPYTTVPYFWSDWYDSRIQFVGVSRSGEGLADVEEEVVMGDEGGPFVALYRFGDRLVGALAVDKRAEVMQYRRLIMNKASWDEGQEKAEERRQRAAKKAAEAAAG